MSAWNPRRRADRLRRKRGRAFAEDVAHQLRGRYLPLRELLHTGQVADDDWIAAVWTMLLAHEDPLTRALTSPDEARGILALWADQAARDLALVQAVRARVQQHVDQQRAAGLAAAQEA